MRKAFLVLSSLLVLASSAFAQETFFPGFQLGIKGGAGVTVGETEIIKNLMSPAAALDLGYQFTPTFGLRADIAGWQGKGYIPAYAESYKFNNAQIAIDGTFDLCNLFGGYKTRAVNPYLFLGIGGNARFNNGAPKAKLPAENLYWEGTAFSPVGRVGLGIDFRLSDLVAIELEGVENAYLDGFNSKKGDALDHQINVLAGLKFNFGANKAKKAAIAAAEAAAAAAAAEAAAAAAKAKKALDDAIAAANQAIANAQKALKANDYLPEDVAAINDLIKKLQDAIKAGDTDSIVALTKALNDAVAKADKNLADAKAAAEKAAAEKAAAEKAAYEAAKAKALQDAIQAAKLNNNDVFFTIGKTNIRSSEQYKIAKIVKKLNANPDAKVAICGFADKQTGNPEGNMVLSEERAKIVTEAIINAGIDPSRVSTFWYGDVDQVSKYAERNRVAVMVTE